MADFRLQIDFFIADSKQFDINLKSTKSEINLQSEI